MFFVLFCLLLYSFVFLCRFFGRGSKFVSFLVRIKTSLGRWPSGYKLQKHKKYKTHQGSNESKTNKHNEHNRGASLCVLACSFCLLVFLCFSSWLLFVGFLRGKDFPKDPLKIP